jgi:Protein of unknown function (DUF3313)
MDKIFRNCFFIFAGILAFTLVGCAGHEAARTGFLKDYSKLEAHPDVDGRFRYINPSVDASKYSKFIVDPVAINLSKEGKEEVTDPEDLQGLAKHFHQKITEELQKGYQVVQSSGPGVARVRTSISEVEKTNPALNIHPGTKITGAGLGGAGAEMELVDSVSGQTIAAAIDNQKGSRLSIGAGLTWLGNAEEVMENWAEDLKKWVDETHGKPAQ